eukprot:4747076-Pleurochrysis_carterae.AAC.4
MPMVLGCLLVCASVASVSFTERARRYSAAIEGSNWPRIGCAGSAGAHPRQRAQPDRSARAAALDGWAVRTRRAAPRTSSLLGECTRREDSDGANCA